MNNLKKYAGLLNDEAPKNHLLAYITPSERDMLIDAGGIKTPTPSGIFAYPPGGGDWGGSMSESGGGGGGKGDNDGNNRNTNYGISPGRSMAQYGTAKYAGLTETAARDRNSQDQKIAQQKAVKEKAIAAEQDRQKRVAEAEAAAKERAKKAKEQDDARLDYFTTEYLDVKLNPEQKKEFEQYRTGVRESINPSQKTSNKVVGGLLSTVLFPGAGTLYNGYLDATAMGYKLKNPFGDIFGGKSEISVEDVNNLRDGGGGDNARSQLIQNVAKIINPNLPDSQVNNYFKNIGSNSLGVSPAYMNTYNQAKDQVSKSLNLTPNNQQFGYGNTFNDNYSMSMTSANPFFDELTNQGLI